MPSSFHLGCALVDTVAVDTVAVPPEGPPAPQRCPNEHMSSDADVAGIGAAAEENGAFFLDTEPELVWFRGFVIRKSDRPSPVCALFVTRTTPFLTHQW